MPQHPSNRVLTVMFTDIKGFSERTSASSRAGLVDLLNQHDELLLPVVKSMGGNVVKTIGDALLATFTSPTNAVLAGLLMQERLRQFNASVAAEQQLHVRVALNTGEVEERQGDVYGEAVNIAARIEGLAEPGEVYFTDSVYLAMNKSEVPTSSVGRFRLKGIPEQVQVYRVLNDPEDATYQALITRLLAKQKSYRRSVKRPAYQHSSAKNVWQRMLPISLGALAFALLLAVGYFWYSEPANTQLRQARALYDEQQHRESAGVYQELLEQQAENWALHEEVVQRFGHQTGKLSTAFAQQAMWSWLPQLRRSGQPLTAMQAQTLADALFAAPPFDAGADQLRRELGAEKSVLALRFLETLHHRDPVKRLHAKLFLAQNTLLSKADELAFHWRNVVELPYGHKRELLAAAKYFQSQPDDTLLATVDIARLNNAMLWRSNGETAGTVLQALSAAFGEQLQPVLTRWQQDSSQPTRALLARKTQMPH